MVSIIALLFAVSLLHSSYPPELSESDQKRFEADDQRVLRNSLESIYSHCELLRVPGLTPILPDGSFSYITSYYYDEARHTLWMAGLGNKFFSPKLGQNNFAKNLTFPVDLLKHPLHTFGNLRSGDHFVHCTKVQDASTDVSMQGKLHVSKCVFKIDPPQDWPLVLTVRSELSKETNSCLRLIRGQPVGTLSSTTRRPRAMQKNQASTSLCIAGVTNFSKDAAKFVEVQAKLLRLDHVYLGLNSEDTDLLDKYRKSVDLPSSKLTVSMAPVPQSTILFSQGKMPFVNECLMQARYHSDAFLGVWDIDEMLTINSSLGLSLGATITMARKDVLSTTCFVRVGSHTFLRQEQPGRGVEFSPSGPTSLAEKFNRRSIDVCANYTKSIAVVDRVDYIGIHLPESCDLYPVKKVERKFCVLFHLR